MEHVQMEVVDATKESRFETHPLHATLEGTILRADLARGNLIAHVPPRYCSLDVSTSGGDVSIEKIVEANLFVTSSGGKVDVRQARGTLAKIISGDGDVFLGEMSARSSLKATGKGSLTAKKIVGPDVDVSVEQGDVFIHALYGERVDIESKGGNINVRHLASETSHVYTTSGSVILGGVQGSLRVFTVGRSIDMYLHDQAREIEARSKGGPIICKVPRELRARVRFQGGKVHIKDNLHFTKTEDGAVLSGFLGPSEIDEPSTTIHLFADAGEIILEEGSWLQNVLGDSAKDFLRPISS